MAKEKVRYLVCGDHTVLKRPDKFFRKFNEALDYKTELLNAGYENVKMTREVYR